MRPLYDKSARVSCVVSEELRDLIDRVAEKRGFRRSDVLRLALEQFQPVMEDMASA